MPNAGLQEIEFDDLVMGQKFRVRVSENYTTISLGPRDWYFLAEDGSFDGTGCDLTGDRGYLPGRGPKKKTRARQAEPR